MVVGRIIMELTLPQVLDHARAKYGRMTDEELQSYTPHGKVLDFHSASEPPKNVVVAMVWAVPPAVSKSPIPTRFEYTA